MALLKVTATINTPGLQSAGLKTRCNVTPTRKDVQRCTMLHAELAAECNNTSGVRDAPNVENRRHGESEGAGKCKGREVAVQEAIQTPNHAQSHSRRCDVVFSAALVSSPCGLG